MLTEIPPDAQPLKLDLVHAANVSMKAMREAIIWLFTEDSKYRAIIDKHLTPDFITKFAAEHARMVREREEGVFDREDDAIQEIQKEVSSNAIIALLRAIRDFLKWFFQAHKAHSELTRQELFNIVWKEMVPEEVKKLPTPYYGEVTGKLREACGLVEIH